MSKTKVPLGWVTAIAFLCLFLLGLIDNLKGTTLPSLLTELHLTDALGGYILLWAYLGFLGTALLVGMLADIAGLRLVVLTSGAFLLLGMLGYSTAHQLGWLAASMGVLGMGLSGVDMSGNLIVVAYYAQNRGRYLNLMSFFHGLSSTIAPYYAGLMLSAGFSWRLVYQYPLVAVGILLLIGFFAPFPSPQVIQKSGIDFREVGRIIIKPGMSWFFVLMILYVSSEIGVASWIVTFLQRSRGLNITASSLYLSLYFAGLMSGRLLGTLIVEKAGYLRSIIFSSLAATTCLSLGIYGPSQMNWLLPFTGLFFSIIFPTITAAVANRVNQNVGTVMGLLFAFCGIGGALGPWLIGVISSHAGIQAGFSLNLLTCSALTTGSLLLNRLLKNLDK